MNPLISVIVPIYKVESLLPGCIDSILAQTYENLEVILVDDGSPDNCGRICDEYAGKDSRIRVIHQKNAGLAGARNAGLEIARGEYLGFVDSDDRIAPQMYETLLASMEAEQADIAICGRYMEFMSGDLVPMFTLDQPQVMDAHEAVRKFLISEDLDAAAWDKLYRRSFWGDTRYPLNYISEDVPVTSRLLARANRVVHCGQPLYYYLQRAGSLSHAAFNEKCLGIYYFYKEVGLEMGQRFPDLREEGLFFYYKALLVLLFRYAGSRSSHAVGKELYRMLRQNIMSICANRYLPKKYKIFALAGCVGIDRLAVRVSDRFAINDNSLTQ